MKTFTILAVFLFLCQGVFSQAVGTTYQPVVSQNTYFDVSAPLTEIGPIPPRGATGHHQYKGHPGIPERDHETVYKNPENALPKGDDPVWQKDMGSRSLTQPIVNFQGVRNDDNGGYYDLIAPPDTDGDVGPNHYFQMCNTIFEIFDKNGTSLFGPADNSTIWDGFVGDWTGTNDGDPIVLYDEQADRWLVSQFAVDTDITGGTYWVLVAISTTANPMGSYYRYAFEFTDFPDYPKFGIWRDGYYLMVQHGNGTATASALNRSQMIAGNATAQMVSYYIPNLPGSGFTSVLPADNDGDWAPSGTPNYFVYFSDDAWGDDPNDCLKIWEFDVYWPIPWFSSLVLTQSLNTASFSSAFGGHNEGIIPQPGTTRKLAVVEKALMHRLQYRNFGTYQSMVCCHTVDVNGSNRAGIRWYELRKTTGSWYIHQQGTYAPGSTDNYWMASIAQNSEGDIALGYSISSSSTYPSVRYTGRKSGDPTGLMTMGESVIINGDDAQLGTSRWGDYSMMSVDPSDDLTFWYTNEYNDDITTWGNWLTQIASFQFNDYCTAGASSTAYEHISNVSIGSINNSTGSSGYANYTNLSTDIPLNGSDQVTVTNGYVYSGNQCGIWVDWNRDEDFNDAGETITVSGTPGTGPYTATIAPPSGVTMGECVMRIRITYNTAPDPCGIISFGEVEDYTINVTSAIANVWTGTYNHYWHQANNWSLGHIPTSVEPVEIPNVGYQPVYVDDYPLILQENCKTLLLEDGATLVMRNQKLVVHEVADIQGNIIMDEEDAILDFMDMVTWHSTSTLEANHNSTFINVYGTWEAQNGSDLTPDMGFVDFRGTTNAYIRSYDPGNKFYNLRIYKQGGAELGLSTFSTQPLRVKNLIYTYPGSLFNNYDNEDIILEGAFNFYGTFDMTLNNNSSSFIFDGVNASLNNYSTGSGIFNNVVFSASNQAVAYSNFTVAKNLTIEQGTFNPNGHTVTVKGNWTNSVGPGGFNEADSRVIFNGTGHQYVYGDEHFNILEVNNGAALRLNNAAYDVSCNVYDWTAGGIDIVAGNFTANDLADNGLYGTYWCNPNGTLTLTQDGAQYVDLNGEIHIFGGTMTVNGGLGSSYWPYANDALISMSDGVLNFANPGIYIYGASMYTLTTDITGGTIRTSGSFYGTSNEFTPAGGTVELYGTSDASVGIDGGSHFHGLRIDKGSKSSQVTIPAGNSGDILNDPARPAEPVRNHSRANAALAYTDFNVSDNLTIESGIFDVGEFNVTVNGDVYIHGTLAMTDPSGDLTADFIEWYSGSEDNVTAGTFHAYEWRFNEGTNAMIGVGNTAYVKNLFYSLDDNAEFGNLVAQPYSKVLTNPGSRAFYPIRVTGDFTIQSGVNWFFVQPDAGIIVNGNATIEEGASISFSENEFIVDGNITLAGTLNVSNQALAIVHGEITWPETGSVNIQTNGEVIFDSPYHGKGWEWINGHLGLTEGLFEITYNSTRFNTTATTSISGGTIRTGGAFYAADPGVFEPTGGTVEVIGDTPDVNIYCYGGNFFYNFVLNRAPGTYSDLETAQAVDIKNDLTILSGILDTESTDLLIGGNWTNNVGPDGFVENTNEVWFYGETYSHIYTDETFYDLYIFDYLTDKGHEDGGKIVDETYVEDGVTVNVLNNCRFLGGSLNMGNSTILDVDSSMIFNGGQLIVPGGTAANIFAGANFENYNPGQAFFPGNSTFTFDGTADQDVTSDAGTVFFNNLEIDNPGNFIRFDVNTHISGDVHAMNGTFVNVGLSHTNTFEGDITVDPNGAFLPKGIINFEGNENTVFNDQSTITSYLWGDVYVDKSADNLSILVEDDMIILNGYSIDVLTGVVDLNGTILRCTENVSIHDGGKLIVDAGARVEVGDDASLNVISGGVLEVIGSSGNPALVTAHNAVLGHRYFFNVNAGGTISAKDGIFEYMKIPYGVHIKDGAIIDPVNNFQNCLFRNGGFGGGSSFLSINNDQELTISGVSFPDASCDYNVGKDPDQGHITFVDYTGDFSGEDFDYDPYNRVDWYEATLEASPAVLDVGSDAGSVTFDVISNLDWTATESTGWFSISPSFGTGNATITVNYNENISVIPRSGEITLSAPDVPDVIVTVNQDGADYIFTVIPSNRNVSAAAGTTTFNVEANPGWTWDVTETVPWLSVSPTSGTGNATLTVTYDENPNTSTRIGTIYFPGGVDATVTQAGADIIFSVTPAIRNVGAPAGSTTFSVTSNLDWTVSESVPWFSVNPMSGTNNGTLTVNYTQNTSVNPRTGEITVSAEGVPDVVVSVVQAGVAATLTVTPANRNVGPDAGNTPFSVASNTGWTVSESSPWLSAVPANGSGNGTITAYFNQNLSGSVRVAEIQVTASGGAPVEIVTVTQAPYESHTIALNAGWQGLSSYIMPVDNDIETVFGPVLPDFILAATNAGTIYYPGGPVNTIGTWNSQSAYKLKMAAPANLMVMGEAETNKTFGMSAGWNLVPVICNYPVDAASAFAGVDLTFMKDVAGLGVLWPEMGINTLGDMEPGLAYYALLGAPGSVTFPANADQGRSNAGAAAQLPDHPWDKITITPNSHMIAIWAEGMVGIEPGDIIGTFNTEMHCYGVSEIFSLQQNAVLTAYGDDAFSGQMDGFMENEYLRLALYRPSTGETFDLEAEYDESRPNTGYFAPEGLSVIISLTADATGVDGLSTSDVAIYPNPTSGLLEISGIDCMERIEVFNVNGERILTATPVSPDKATIDLSRFNSGIYQVRIICNSYTLIKKVIRQ